MIVYRYMAEEELKKFLNGNIENIGSVYNRKNFKDINTHHYKKDTKYLHFFKELKNVADMRLFKNDVKGNFYVCMFKLPFNVLFGHSGYGYYKPRGYKFDCTIVKEFAIQTKLIKPEFLVAFSYDENRFKLIAEIEKDFKACLDEAESSTEKLKI